MYVQSDIKERSCKPLLLWKSNKGKGKGREAGVYSALQLEEADCTLTP
jgi:hypothetical protein